MWSEEDIPFKVGTVVWDTRGRLRYFYELWDYEYLRESSFLLRDCFDFIGLISFSVSSKNCFSRTRCFYFLLNWDKDCASSFRSSRLIRWQGSLIILTMTATNSLINTELRLLRSETKGIFTFNFYLEELGIQSTRF